MAPRAFNNEQCDWISICLVAIGVHSLGLNHEEWRYCLCGFVKHLAWSLAFVSLGRQRWSTICYSGLRNLHNKDKLHIYQEPVETPKQLESEEFGKDEVTLDKPFGRAAFRSRPPFADARERLWRAPLFVVKALLDWSKSKRQRLKIPTKNKWVPRRCKELQKAPRWVKIWFPGVWFPVCC